MKSNLIILGLSLALVGSANAYEQFFTTAPAGGFLSRLVNPFSQSYYSPWGMYNNAMYNPFNSPLNRYWNYPSYSTRINRVQRQRILRRQNRLRRNYWSPLGARFLKNNLLSWDFPGKGYLTGYSTPISSDVYKQMGIQDPKDNKQRLNSPTCNTELFSAPKTDSYYDRSSGYQETNGGGTASKTGVTIIYD